MRLATFDPGEVTGFAHGDPFLLDQAAPFSGAFELPKKTPLTRSLIALEAWSMDLIKGNGITDVWIEKPILPKVTSFAAVSTIAGRAFVLGMSATKCGCNCSLVDIQSWRSQLGLPTQGPKNVLADPYYGQKFGRRKDALKAAKRQYVKDRAFDFAVKQGADPNDENEADAVCIWYAVAALKRAKADVAKFDLFDSLNI